VVHTDGDEEDLDEEETKDAVKLYDDYKVELDDDSTSLARTHKQTAASVRAAPSAKKAKLNGDREPDMLSGMHKNIRDRRGCRMVAGKPKNTHSLDVLAITASAANALEASAAIAPECLPDNTGFFEEDDGFEILGGGWTCEELKRRSVLDSRMVFSAGSSCVGGDAIAAFNTLTSWLEHPSIVRKLWFGTCRGLRWYTWNMRICPLDAANFTVDELHRRVSTTATLPCCSCRKCAVTSWVIDITGAPCVAFSLA
jgi:hypothetical protein